MKAEHKYSFSYVPEKNRTIKTIFRRCQKCIYQKSRRKFMFYPSQAQ